MRREESNLHGFPVSPLRKASGFQLGGEQHLITGSGPKPYREPVTIKVATLEEAKKCKVKEQCYWGREVGGHSLKPSQSDAQVFVQRWSLWWC